MPDLQLTLKNETRDALDFTETSPRDPQHWTVPGNGEETVTIRETPLGRVRVIVSQGFLCSTMHSCSPNRNNLLAITVHDNERLTTEIGSQPGDRFTVEARNRSGTRLWCVLLGPALEDMERIRANETKTLSLPSTGYMKIVFLASPFSGFVQIPFASSSESFTVTAQIVDGSPTVSCAPTR